MGSLAIRKKGTFFLLAELALEIKDLFAACHGF